MLKYTAPLWQDKSKNISYYLSFNQSIVYLIGEIDIVNKIPSVSKINEKGHNLFVLRV